MIKPTMPPEFLAELRTRIAAAIQHDDPTVTTEELRTPNISEQIDLTVLATTSALESILLVADRGHCKQCSRNITNMALRMLPELALCSTSNEQHTPIEVFTVNSREELEALFTRLGLDDDGEPTV